MMNDLTVLNGDALLKGLDHEWLLTDGMGGFAMGTVSGTPQRRYHALFNAATKPPVGRTSLLQAMADWVVVTEPGRPEQRFPLTQLAFAGGEPVSSIGVELFEFFHSNIPSFLYPHPTCSWAYRITAGFGTFMVGKELALSSDGLTLEYTLPDLPPTEGWDVRFELRPLLSLRDFHELRSPSSTQAKFEIPPIWENDPDDDDAEPPKLPSVFYVESGPSRLGAQVFGGHLIESHEVWRNVHYKRDAARGQESTEDLLSPGFFRSESWREILRYRGDPGYLRVALAFTGGLKAVDPEKERLKKVFSKYTPLPENYGNEPIDIAALEAQEAEIDALLKAAQTPSDSGAASPDPLARLTASAAQFIVRRDTPAGPKPSVIAGYPWFSDWGRDTMISLPGLFLVTGRHTEARDTLLAFAALMQDGLIPNCFDNGSGEAEYNTVDASLWFIQAACNLADATKDSLPPELVNACRSIIAAYTNGTRFNIRMDPADSLIAAGDASTQLTWMDARRNGVVFTPRHGKPVEINALWHSGLVRFASLIAADHPAESAALHARAARVAESFRAAFWNPKDACLFDCLTPNGASWTSDSAIRPNQLFAVSLPHSPLSADQQRAVVACATKHLLTPVGMRTLAPGSPGYRARFEGDLFSRDGAYHNGTVWPWLIGPYIEALLRAHNFSDAARVQARAALKPLLDEFNGTGPTTQSIASIAEVYDADELPNQPRRPDGCPMQAWSVAEVLRAYVLINTP